MVVVAISEDEEIIVKPNAVLEIQLDRMVKDYAPKSDDPFDEIFGANNKKLGLNEIINAIENAKYDDNIKGISIFQIIQKKDKTIDFIYVPEQDFIVDEMFILKGLKQRLGNLPINIIKKSQILRDKNIGKIRVIKNEIQV